MKKLTAIFFLLILLFNCVGYQALTHFLQRQADRNTQALINAGHYQHANLIELSVTLDLPYTTNWTGWEHHEGSIEIDGVHHRYVERKLEGGRMIVRCLPNEEKTAVLAARDEFAKLVNSFNQQPEPTSKAPVFVNNYLGDYDDTSYSWDLSAPLLSPAAALAANNDALCNGHAAILQPPPDPMAV